MKKLSHYHHLLELFRLHQQEHMFIGRAYGSAISTTQAYLLIEVAIDASRRDSEYAENLRIDKSSVSRNFAQLLHAGMLSELPHPTDKRRTIKALTDAGRAFLEIHDRETNRALSVMTSRISHEEEARLVNYLTQMADGDDAPVIRIREGENPSILPIRRLSHSHGITGESFMGSGSSSITWQFLSEIARDGVNTTPSHLARALSISMPFVSQVSAKLVKAGLIVTRRQTHDRRSMLMTITTKGRQALDAIVNAGAIRLKRSLKRLSNDQLQDLLSLFQRFVVGDAGRIVLKPGLEIVSIEDDRMRSEARALIIKFLVRTNQALNCPPKVVDTTHTSFALMSGPRLVAALDFVLDDHGTTLSSAGWEESGFGDDLSLREFIDHTLASLGKNRDRRVVFPPYVSAALTRYQKELEPGPVSE